MGRAPQAVEGSSPSMRTPASAVDDDVLGGVKVAEWVTACTELQKQ